MENLKLTDNSLEIVPNLGNDDYHAPTKSDSGKYFLSSSELGKYMSINLFPYSGESAKFGTSIHNWIAGQIDPSQFFAILPPYKNSEGKAVRQGTKEFKELYAQTQLKMGGSSDNFCVLNQTDYDAAMNIMSAVTPFIEEFKKSFCVYCETSFYVGADHLKNSDFPFFCDFMTMYFDCGAKVRPDIVTIDEDGIHIYDWKTTSKNTLEEFVWQVKKLDYLFSLWYYAQMLQIVLKLPVASINLIPLAKSKQSFGPCQVTMTEDEIFSLLDFDSIENRLYRGINYFKQAKNPGIMKIEYKEFV